MNVTPLRSCLLLATALLTGSCSEADKTTSLPPALPVVHAAPAETEPGAPSQAVPSGRETPREATAASKSREKSPRKPTAAKPSQPKSSSAASSRPSSAPAASKPQASKPEPSTPAALPTAAPAPAKPAAKRVSVPRTANVHFELPAGLQADLDADPRMQKWIDSVVSIIDGCHAKNRAARGVIETTVTMHENERPDADIRALPGALSGVVACATGALMRVKMPLFTGREGTRYPVRIVFE